VELLKNTIIEKDFERASQPIPVQVTENWLTGFAQDKICVSAAMLAFFLGQHKGRTTHSPNSFQITNITEARMETTF